MNVSNIHSLYQPPKENEPDSGVYGNVRECILLFENGTQKIFTNEEKKGCLTVNVLSHEAENDPFVEAVIRNYGSCKTLDELTLKCGYRCTKTFTRHFIRHFHMTPKQWQLEIKKHEMISSLKNTRHPLKQIASELGFANVSHLSDFCYKKTGLRPDEIRKNK